MTTLDKMHTQKICDFLVFKKCPHKVTTKKAVGGGGGWHRMGERQGNRIVAVRFPLFFIHFFHRFFVMNSRASLPVKMRSRKREENENRRERKHTRKERGCKYDGKTERFSRVREKREKEKRKKKSSGEIATCQRLNNSSPSIHNNIAAIGSPWKSPALATTAIP